MIEQRVRDDLKQAMRERDEVRKSILRVALAEFQKAAYADGVQAVKDEVAIKCIQKLIKNNDETLSFRENETLVKENVILSALLPQMMTRDEIVAVVDGLSIEPGVKFGQVMGMAMAKLKATGKLFDNALVSEVVKSKVS